MVINDHSLLITRRQRNKTRIRDSLRQVALHLFRTRGYEVTSVQQIADAADTAKATFFNYYPTKEHLLAEFHELSVRDILASHAKAGSGDTRQSLLDLARAAMRWPVREPQLTAAIVRNLWGNPVLAETDRQIGEAFTERVENILRDGIGRGEIRPDIDVKVAIALIMSALNGCVLDWVMEEQRFNLTATATKRMSLLLAAFETTKARRRES